MIAWLALTLALAANLLLGLFVAAAVVLVRKARPYLGMLGLLIGHQAGQGPPPER